MEISTKVKEELDLYCQKYGVDYDFVIKNGLNYIPDEKYGGSLLADRLIERIKRIRRVFYDNALIFKVVKHKEIENYFDAIEIYILNSYDKSPKLECRYIWEYTGFEEDFEIIQKALPTVEWVK